MNIGYTIICSLLLVISCAKQDYSEFVLLAEKTNISDPIYIVDVTSNSSVQKRDVINSILNSESKVLIYCGVDTSLLDIIKSKDIIWSVSREVSSRLNNGLGDVPLHNNAIIANQNLLNSFLLRSPNGYDHVVLEVVKRYDSLAYNSYLKSVNSTGYDPILISRLNTTIPTLYGEQLLTSSSNLDILSIEDDPDLTDKKFPGNPTKSYRSTEPFRVVGEVTVWQGHPAEQIKTMKEQGINSLNK